MTILLLKVKKIVKRGDLFFGKIVIFEEKLDYPRCKLVFILTCILKEINYTVLLAITSQFRENAWKAMSRKIFKPNFFYNSTN